MEQELSEIVETARREAAGLQTKPEFEAFKARYVGPKGSLTQISKGMGKLPKEERPAMGKAINAAKQELEALFAETLARIEAVELAARLGEPVDPTLPSPEAGVCGLHPLRQVRRELCDVFGRIGFSVAEGTEIETDWYCFDALNTPADHPARDEQDTLFFPPQAKFPGISRHKDEPYLLRTHTSPVQIRTMMAEKPPIRIVAPGRCFRRDTVDATHSANFHQIEGLYVDRKVTVADLKATLDYFVHQVFGPSARSRLRPSFFPFTEPSFELDFMSPDFGKLSNKWIEVLGCGMVDPEVFCAVGYDPDEWSGFAFGIGIERIAMLKEGVDDIRNYYQNDLRFLRQFA